MKALAKAAGCLLTCVALHMQAMAETAAPAAGAASAPLTVYDVLTTRAAADLSVPASPAFAILGLTPTSIQRPGSVRELMAAATKGFDKDGKVKNGLAIDIAPMSMFARERIVGGDRYRDSPVTQALARTTVSLGTAESGGGTQLAWGVRVGVWDQGDPGLFAGKLAKCVRESNPFGGPPPAGPNVTGPTQAQQEATLNAIADCKVPELVEDLWAKPALYVGFGQSWYSGSGSAKDKLPAAKALWATYSVGRSVASYRGLLQLNAERKTDERVADPADATKLLRQDTTALVARLKLGAEKWHAYADLGRNRLELAGKAKVNTRYSGLGVDLRLRDDLWLQVGRSNERGFIDGSAQNKVLVGFRWGTKPLLENLAPGK